MVGEYYLMHGNNPAAKAYIAGGTGNLAYRVNDTVRMVDMEDVIGIEKIANNQEDND